MSSYSDDSSNEDESVTPRANPSCDNRKGEDDSSIPSDLGKGKPIDNVVATTNVHENSPTVTASDNFSECTNTISNKESDNVHDSLKSFSHFKDEHSPNSCQKINDGDKDPENQQASNDLSLVIAQDSDVTPDQRIDNIQASSSNIGADSGETSQNKSQTNYFTKNKNPSSNIEKGGCQNDDSVANSTTYSSLQDYASTSYVRDKVAMFDEITTNNHRRSFHSGTTSPNRRLPSGNSPVFNRSNSFHEENQQHSKDLLQKSNQSLKETELLSNMSIPTEPISNTNGKLVHFSETRPTVLQRTENLQVKRTMTINDQFTHTETNITDYGVQGSSNHHDQNKGSKGLVQKGLEFFSVQRKKGNYKLKNMIRSKMNSDSSSNQLEIRFHCLVKSIELRKRPVHISIYSDQNSWNTVDVNMKKCEEIDQYVHLQGTFNIDRENLSRGISYRYLICYDDESFDWENSKNSDYFRTLRIENPDDRIVEQYDNIVSTSECRIETSQTFLTVTKLFVKFDTFENIWCTINQVIKIYEAEGKPSKWINDFMKYHLSAENGQTCEQLKQFVMVLFLEINLQRETSRDLVLGLFDVLDSVILLCCNDPKVCKEMSSEIKILCLESIGSLIDRYFHLIKENQLTTSYCWLSGYAFINIIRDTEDEKHYFNMDNWVEVRKRFPVTKDKIPVVLRLIERIPENMEILKREFLEACSFTELQNILPMKISERFCPNLILNKVLSSIIENSKVMKSLTQEFISYIRRKPSVLQKVQLHKIEDLVNNTTFQGPDNIFEVFAILNIVYPIAKERVDVMLRTTFDKLIQMSNDIELNTLQGSLYIWSDILKQFPNLESHPNVIEEFESKTRNWNYDQLNPQLLCGELHPEILKCLFRNLIKKNLEKSLLKRAKLAKNLPSQFYINTVWLVKQILESFSELDESSDDFCTLILQTIMNNDVIQTIVDFFELTPEPKRQDVWSFLSDDFLQIMEKLDIFHVLLEEKKVSLKAMNLLNDQTFQHNLERFYGILKNYGLNKDQYIVLIKNRLFDYEKHMEKFATFGTFLQCLTERFQVRIENYSEFLSLENTKLKDVDSSMDMKINPGSVLSQKIITKFDLFKESKMFSQYLRSSLAENDDPEYSIPQIIQLCETTEAKYETFCQSLAEGSITVGELFQVSETFWKHDESSFQNELDICVQLNEENLQVVKQSIEKITFLVKLFKRSNILKSLQNTCEIIKINGQLLKQLENFIRISERENLLLESTISLISIPDMEDFEEIFSICEDHTDALEAFNRSKDIIEWVQKYIKDIQALKVFVDLALSSLPEYDLNVDRIHCFQLALLAYSCLLFDLNSNCCATDLVQTFKNLKESLDVDSNAPTKLLESNRYLKWFGLVRERHTSLDRSSLTELKRIIKYGHLMIKVKDREHEISIVIEKGTKSSQYKDLLQGNNLEELESKLMLMKFQQKHQKQRDHFLDIMEKTKLIKSSLTSLVEKGCSLFQQFTLKCILSSKKVVSLITDFGFKTQIIKGKENLIDEMDSMRKFLEKCQTEWQDYLTRLRDEYPLLNYYTNVQLDILAHACSDIFHNQSDDKDPMREKKAHALFRLISKSITSESIKNAVNDSLQCFEGTDDTHGATQQTHLTDVERPESLTIFGVDEKTEKLQSLRCFVENILSSYSVEESNVLAAIRATKEHSDPDSVAEWCNDNPDEQASWDDLTRQLFPDEDQLQVKNQNGAMSFRSIESESEMNLRWKEFLNRNNDAQKCESISFDSLNSIIQNLYSSHAENDVNRSLPIPLKSGAPNLLITSTSEIFETLLTIYATDKSKPLPGLDEILICEENTSLEQVILHCERSFSDKTGKIYSIVFAEKISFESCSQIEKLFLKQLPNTYNLVFLVTEEEGRQSRIANIFIRYRINKSIKPDSEYLSDYLHYRLKSQDSDEECQSNLSEFSFRIIRSSRSGEGKSILSQRISENLDAQRVILPIYSDEVDYSHVIKSMFRKSVNPEKLVTLFHFNLTPNCKTEYEAMIFSLAIMSGVRDEYGGIWIRSPQDYITAEIVRSDDQETHFVDILPTIFCKSPRESLKFYQNNPEINTESVVQLDGNRFCQLMSHSEYESVVFQRPAQYLQKLKYGSVEHFNFETTGLNVECCLVELLGGINFVISDPSWIELANFCKYLNYQLVLSEKSVFCNINLTGFEFNGFKTFVVNFLIKMSKDFTIRSATISDESLNAVHIPDKRRWESNPHPYIFFNEDGQTISFFGFKIQNLNLINEKEEVLEENVMRPSLFETLKRNGIDFSRDLSKISENELRDFYLEELCRIFGIERTDETGIFDRDFELTSDNVLKMLAIYVRLKADIPIVIIGETGVGKTRLIQFMCNFMKQNPSEKNLMIVKCHGGTTCSDIHAAVNKAIDMVKDHSSNNMFVIFFDEANTTDAVGAIKEVMCDRHLNGVPIPGHLNLKFIAAMNPYRKHSDEMIQKLESAGLGYHVEAKKTRDKTGPIPMRHLVYRVKECPPSFLPLIWDFGRLSTEEERKYIDQMVQNYITRKKFPEDEKLKSLFSAVLCECQRMMIARNDECSHVSLRDIERCLTVHEWMTLKNLIQEVDSKSSFQKAVDHFILSIGFTYYVRLDDRKTFFVSILPIFRKFLNSQSIQTKYFTDIIKRNQEMFLNEIKLDTDISKNEALQENVWMMIICIELKIPLFLIGKPGTSKSLAKSVVNDVMQGTYSYSELFKKFKEIHMISFQCSQLSTSESIQTTFRIAQEHQKRRIENFQTFSSVVVLDEIGLAEDCPNMPLKVLHPLLECTKQDEEYDELNKVAFIGISNWALDPAKMNRGVFVSRGELSREDLIVTLNGICSKHFKEDHSEFGCQIDDYIEQIVDGYLQVSEEQNREYYGLRELYSLIKMLIKECQESKGITSPLLRECIYRCFGGAYGEFLPAQIIMKYIKSLKSAGQQTESEKLTMIRKALQEQQKNRYLLFLTKNNVAFHALIEKDLCDLKCDPTLMFGSSFPCDRDYITACKSINQIKLAMETGKLLVLCNLSHIYESLYDVLNQSYVRLGDDYKYADLGLGTHRVKCRVDNEFRIIIVAEDVEVFNNFPPPLINRLEKHYLDAKTLLDPEMNNDAVELDEWINRFCDVKGRKDIRKPDFRFKAEDVFIGYYEDVAAMTIQRSSKMIQNMPDRSILYKAKCILMNCATPDSILRLTHSSLSDEEKNEAFEISQSRHNLKNIRDILDAMSEEQNLLIQVTTHSHIDKIDPSKLDDNWRVETLFLDLMKTEQEFRRILNKFFTNCSGTTQSVFIIQWIYYPQMTNENFLECVRFCIRDESRNLKNFLFRVILVIQIPRCSGETMTRIMSPSWMCYHLDEAYQQFFTFDFLSMKGQSISSVMDNLDDKTFQDLLKASVHGSCAQTLTNCATRIMTRIRILEEALANDKDFEFTKSLKNIIAQKCLQSVISSDWITDIALNSSYLKEGYTFQRSIWLSLQEAIESVFSKIIEFCDINQGLDHLSNIANASKKEFFLTFLQNIDFIKIEEALMIDKSSKSLEFSSNFPFSWFFHLECERIDGGDREENTLISSTLFSTNYGEILRKYFSENQAEATDCYIKDILLSNWPALDIFSSLLSNISDQIKTDLGEQIATESFSLADLYLFIKTMAPRLSTLSEILSLSDSIIQKSTLKTSLEFYITKFLRPDINIDEIALEMLFSLLDPKNYNLMDKEVRFTWIEAVLQAGKYLSNCRSLSDTSRSEFQINLADLEKMSIFVKHVIFESNGNICLDEVFRKAINTMRLKMKLIRNLKIHKDCESLLGILREISINAGNILFFNGKTKCYLCDEKFREPVCPPCRHVACKRCLEEQRSSRTQSDGQWNCPCRGCNKLYPKEQVLYNATDKSEVKQEYDEFKSKIGLFFLEVLMEFTFSGSSLPENELMDTLLTFKFSNSNPDRAMEKICSFKEDYLDERTIIKSSVFQMMLRCNWNETISYLELYYQKYSQNFEANFDFSLVVLHALENAVVSNKPKATGNLEEYQNMYNSLLKNINFADESSIVTLESIAKMKLCLEFAAFLIYRTIRGHQLSADNQIFLRNMESLLESQHNENYHNFLIAELCQSFGRNYVYGWIKYGFFTNMLPRRFKELDFVYQPDYFDIFGDSYRCKRDLIIENISSKKRLDSLEMSFAPNEIPYLYLTAFHVLNSGNFQDQTKSFIWSFIKNKADEIPEYHSFFTLLKRFTTLLDTENASIQEKAIYFLLYHLFVILMEMKDDDFPIIDLFIQLCFNPTSLQNKFLPTMPQDGLFDVLEVMYDPNSASYREERHIRKFYKCPNGHIYGVGNCGQFVGSGVCPDCPKGTVIGRGQQNATLVDTFQDATQPGHILGNPVDGPVMGVRSLGSCHVASIRFLMHSAMYLSEDIDGISSLISPQVSLNELDTFLMSHIKLNFNQLMKFLDKSEDETQLFLHSFTQRFLTPKEFSESIELSDKAQRQLWEDSFSTNFIQTESTDINFNDFIVTASEDKKKHVSYLRNTSELFDQEEAENTSPYVKNIFKTRVMINLSSLFHKYSAVEISDQCPLLSYLYENQSTLKFISKLSDIIQLQKALVEKFNYQFDINELDNRTLSEFFLNLEENEFIKEKTKKYLEVLSDLKDQIFKHSKKGRQLASFFHEKLINFEEYLGDVPCGIIFPYQNGLGWSAVCLVEYLIDLHNSAITRYFEKHQLKERAKLNSENVTADQLVTFKLEDLETILLLHCDSSLTSEDYLDWSVDLNALEKHLENKYFVGRLLLDKEKSPRLFLSNEKLELSTLSSKIPQIPLAGSIQDLIENRLRTLPDVCLFLKHCQTLKRLVLVTHSVEKGPAASPRLADYLQMVNYRLPDHLAEVAPIHDLNLEHFNDLILFLNVLRAKRMILYHQDPWTAILSPESQDLLESDEMKRSLDPLIQCLPFNRLLSIMFGFIQDFVSSKKAIPTSPLSESLDEYVTYELDKEDGNVFVQHINNEIKVAHSADCFEYLVTKMNMLDA